MLVRRSALATMLIMDSRDSLGWNVSAIIQLEDNVSKLALSKIVTGYLDSAARNLGLTEQPQVLLPRWMASRHS